MHGGWCSPETLNREPRRLGSMSCLRHRQLPPLLGGVLSSQLRASVVLLDIGWYFCKIRCCWFFFMRNDSSQRLKCCQSYWLPPKVIGLFSQHLVRDSLFLKTISDGEDSCQSGYMGIGVSQNILSRGPATAFTALMLGVGCALCPPGLSRSAMRQYRRAPAQDLT